MLSVGSGENRLRESFKTRREAEVAEHEALARLKASGSPLKASTAVQPLARQGKTLGEAYDLTWRLRWKSVRSQETIEHNCRTIFRSIPKQTLLADITPMMVLETIEEWEDEGNCGSTVNRKISALHTMLTEASKQGWCTVPVLPKRKEGEHRIRWMDEPEELTALSWCKRLGLEELHDLMVVAVDTGFRRGELLRLSPKDLIHGKLHLHAGTTKSGKGRAVPVTQRVAEIITRRANQRKVFDISAPALRHQWVILKRAMKLEDDPQFVFHMLRHTCASRLVQNGVPLAVVQAWMGHSTIMTTMRYAHLSPDSLQVGLEALEKVNQRPVLRVVNG